MFAFQKTSSEGQCAWRVQSEGMENLLPYISNKRIVQTSSMDTFRKLCENSFLKISDFEDSDRLFTDGLAKLDEGCAFFGTYLRPEEDHISAMERKGICQFDAVKARHSVSLFNYLVHV